MNILIGIDYRKRKLETCKIGYQKWMHSSFYEIWRSK